MIFGDYYQLLFLSASFCFHFADLIDSLAVNLLCLVSELSSSAYDRYL